MRRREHTIMNEKKAKALRRLVRYAHKTVAATEYIKHPATNRGSKPRTITVTQTNPDGTREDVEAKIPRGALGHTLLVKPDSPRGFYLALKRMGG